MHQLVIMLTILFLAVTSISQPAYCQEEKQSYANVQGDIMNEWRKPAGGVMVSLNSQTNGYSTNNLTAISDVNGHYKISNVPRYIYSAGPEPQAVEYYIAVNNPGYESYSSETFNFKESLSVRKDIRVKSSVVK